MRIRHIKPEFYTDEKVVQLSAVARLLFIGIWNLVDEWGLMEWSPERVQMQLFPKDDLDMGTIVDELVQLRFIIVFELDDRTYCAVRNFHRHQRTDLRAAKRIPPPPSIPDWYKRAYELQQTSERCDEVQTGANRCKPVQTGASNCIAGKGKGKGKGKRKSPPPDLTEEEMALCETAFDAFWTKYPWKSKKLEAKEIFLRRKLFLTETMEKILAGLERARASERWREMGGKFVPLPTTFLNNDRWEDSFDESFLRTGSQQGSEAGGRDVYRRDTGGE